MPSNEFTPIRRRLAALRLASQRISGSERSTPGEVVRWMLGLQAQDLPGVRWSVGLRQHQSAEATVDAALHAREIVRSWPLRGTLHVVGAEDLGWLLELTATRALGSAPARRAYLGGQRGYHLLWYLAQTATLVLGAPEGRQQTFALLDEWVLAPRRLERDEALGELALRYFRSHGPATVQDLARWSGLTMLEVRRGLALCGGQLTTLELDGVTYHLAPEALDAPPPVGEVHLLPGFDEYLLGYGDRSAAVAPAHSQAVVPGGNGMFKPTIVVDGEVVGTWRRTLTARDVLIDLVPFGPLPGTLRNGLILAADAYGAFLGRLARLRGSDADRVRKPGDARAST